MNVSSAALVVVVQERCSAAAGILPIGSVLDAVGDTGEIRVVEIVDQQAERACLLAGEMAGDQVRAVAEARRRPPSRQPATRR